MSDLVIGKVILKNGELIIVINNDSEVTAWDVRGSFDSGDWTLSCYGAPHNCYCSMKPIYPNDD